MAALIGMFFLCLGGVLALGAAVTGTCTQAVDDELLGGVVAAAAYVVGLALLIARPGRGRMRFLLVPFALAFAYQTYWSIGFFIAYHMRAVSACVWTHGDGYADMDGREPFFTWWWLVMALACDAGLIWAWVRRPRSRE